MKRLTISLAVGALAVLAVATAVSAAGPRTQNRDQAQTQTTLTEVLGLTQAEIADLRQDGMTLAQIADRRHVDPEKLVDELAARWSERIEARVANGALTADQATELKTQLELQAKARINQATVGGMRGAAVGAGPNAAGAAGGGFRGGAGNGAGAGRGGSGNGACDGAGPNGAASS